MRHITIFIVIAILLLIPNIAQSLQENGWYPFALTERLDSNSPVNVGNLVLDAPAGKHGFVKVKDGHFYFEDGVRAKFWGTNLCFKANFPNKKQAEVIVDRIAYFGFNAVRLHHMDFYYEPNGIFEDLEPALKDPQMKKTGHLSKKQLDRLDYFIFQLKQHGIYIDINLLVSRKFTKADGVKDADKFSIAAKPVSMFDRRLIDLQKQYAKDLLTHYNPYTKMRYCDDPAIALVEITNENSIINVWKYNLLNGSFFGYKKDALPSFYTNILDQLWNNWLIAKYKTIDNLKSSWRFNAQMFNTTSPLIILSDQQNWTLEEDNDATATLVNSPHQADITITHTTGASWHLQYHVINIALKKNTKYLLKFTAYANIPTEITAMSQQAFPPWESLGLIQNISLSITPHEYLIPYISNQDCPNAKLGFSVGKNIATITIRNISFEAINSFLINQDDYSKQNFSFPRPLFKILAFYPSQVQADIKDFYINLQANYINEMLDYLKNKIGIKIPITGIGGPSDNDNIISEKNADFIDTHTYWDQPKFPHKQWDNNDFIIKNTSMLLDSKLGMIGAILSQVPSPRIKPFTITEWNQCYPNRYAYETPVLMAAQAHQNDWDGLFEFDFSGGSQEFNNIQSYYDIIANPQKLILNSIASRLYLNTSSIKSNTQNGIFSLNSPQVAGAAGEIKDQLLSLGPLNATTAKNGAVFLYSTDDKPIEKSSRLILVTLGDVSNSNSGWTNNIFNWGQGPTRLENIDTRIILDENKTWKIYELTTEGQRGKEILITVENGHHTFSTENVNTPWLELIPINKEFK